MVSRAEEGGTALPLTAAHSRANTSWRERWLEWRNRRYISKPFQLAAQESIFTRWLVRRRSKALFDLLGGFVYSQVLLAFVRLHLHQTLAEGPRSLEELSTLTHMPIASMRRLMQAAVALRLAESRGPERFGIGVLAAPLVENPGICAMVEHHAVLYRDLTDPVALLRQDERDTEMARYWPYAGRHATTEAGSLETADVATYSELMAASQPLVAEQVLSSYPIERHALVLDVGGGAGNFIVAAARKAPRTNFMLFDLPAVGQLARARLAEQLILDRVQIFGGSFFADPLPKGADLVTLVRVLFDHPDERALAILKAVRAALKPGQTVLIAEPVQKTDASEAVGSAYFNMYLLAMGHGELRTPAQFAHLLGQTGFGPLTRHPSPSPLQTEVFSAKAI